jgi:hypothetical protein
VKRAEKRNEDKNTIIGCGRDMHVVAAGLFVVVCGDYGVYSSRFGDLGGSAAWCMEEAINTAESS